MGNAIGTTNISGGVGEYTITWLNQNNDEVDPNDLTEGIYTVIVTDENNCEINGEIEVIYNSLEDIYNNSFNIYPNPTNGTLYCLIENLDEVQNWKLIDLRGTIVETGKIESSLGIIEFDFSRHCTGQYVLLLDSRAIPLVIEK